MVSKNIVQNAQNIVNTELRYRLPREVDKVDGQDRGELILCPTCSREISQFKHYNYCPWCGQMVVWK